MLSRLDGIVNLITGSLVLYSSIGLFALTLNARYTHAIGRVNDFIANMKVHLLPLFPDLKGNFLASTSRCIGQDFLYGWFIICRKICFVVVLHEVGRCLP